MSDARVPEDTSASEPEDAAHESDGGAAGWRQVRLVPDECPFEMAARPETLFELRWSDCGSGCLRLDPPDGAVVGRGRIMDGRPALIVAIGDAAAGVQITTFVLLDEGRPFAAFRDVVGAPERRRAFCAVFDAALSDQGIALAVQYFEFNDAGSRVVRSWLQLLVADGGETPGDLRSGGYRDDFPFTVQQLHREGDRLGFETVAALAWHADGTGTVEPISGPLFGEEVGRINMAPGVVFWETLAAQVRLARWVPGGTATVLHEVSGGDVLSSSVDGTSITWLEATRWDPGTGRYGRVELWTGNVDGERLAGRMVRVLPAHGEGWAGGGYFVAIETDPTAESSFIYAIYRLSDGSRASFDPAGNAGRALLVSESEIVLDAWGQIYRLDPAALDFAPP